MAQQIIQADTATRSLRGWPKAIAWKVTSCREALCATSTRRPPISGSSRPGHGKTRIGLELLIEAAKAGSRAVFFTLEYTDRETLELMRTIPEGAQNWPAIEIDSSDAISAAPIHSKLATAPRGTVAVIDYLQLLDQ